jgi:hypothetical protein
MSLLFSNWASNVVDVVDRGEDMFESWADMNHDKRRIIELG